jgi:hypothetical protein
MPQAIDIKETPPTRISIYALKSLENSINYNAVQVSSVRIQSMRRKRETFLPAQSRLLYILGPVLRAAWSRRNPLSPVATRGRVSGCLGEPPLTLHLPRQPLHWVSNPRLMGFQGSIYIHLHRERLPASSRNMPKCCCVLYCRKPMLRNFRITSFLCTVVNRSELVLSLRGSQPKIIK